MRVSLILVFFICNLAGAQTPQGIAKSLLTVNTDSALISVYKVVTREMMKSEGRETEELLSQKRITQEDAEAILKRASKKSYYTSDRALLTHHNILIDFFRNGSAYGNMTLSSKTGNITINNFTNKQQAFGNVSRKFGDYIIQLLKEYDILKLIYAMDLEGLKKTSID